MKVLVPQEGLTKYVASGLTQLHNLLPLKSTPMGFEVVFGQPDALDSSGWAGDNSASEASEQPMDGLSQGQTKNDT